MTTTTLTTGEVVSLADGYLACDIDQIYKALNSLLDDDLMTHQLPRACRFVEPHIKDACPWLAELPPKPNLDSLFGDERREAVVAWVASVGALHGELHVIPDLASQWVHFDAIDEAVAIFGPDRVIPVQVDPEDPR